ncbi:hypothetical protein Cni_G12263 [Canna indica]|uniref:Uncharacterized protein n=1 Tax=Canna indica TaxID=4628 RepID=A0AAQ3K7I3_9LILI|nr:hypothetical protein Cni_G12263 [Canna indica]
MNDRGEDKVLCYFHPKESVVGVCAHCLKERLVLLASKQGQPPQLRKSKRPCRVVRRKRIINIKLPRVFALGPFLYRLDSRYRGDEDDNDDSDDEGSIASNEDSFISVKFDNDGHASWDKEAMKTKSSAHGNGGGNEANGNQNMVDKTKNSTMKWKKRIGQLLHLAQSKRSTDQGNLQVGVGGKDGGANRKGWVIRSLTRRRATKRYSSV